MRGSHPFREGPREEVQGWGNPRKSEEADYKKPCLKCKLVIDCTYGSIHLKGKTPVVVLAKIVGFGRPDHASENAGWRGILLVVLSMVQNCFEGREWKPLADGSYTLKGVLIYVTKGPQSLLLLPLQQKQQQHHHLWIFLKNIFCCFDFVCLLVLVLKTVIWLQSCSNE